MLKKIQDLPIEIQLEKLIDNAAWADYAKERIENLFSSLKHLVGQVVRQGDSYIFMEAGVILIPDGF